LKRGSRGNTFAFSVIAQNLSGALHLLSDALHHESAHETRTAIIMPQQGTHFSKCNAVLLRNHDFEQPRWNVEATRPQTSGGAMQHSAGFICKHKERNLKKAIVTDSTSDIPEHLRKKYSIFQVPAILIIEGQAMLDGIGISREEFYKQLPAMSKFPSTAAPSSGSFQQLYRRIFQEGFTEIISIHAASKLSGIFNAARVAAQDFKEKIKVIDSQQLSLGLGFQVLAAAKAAIQNLPTEQILEHIRNTQEKLKLVAFLDTLEYIRRSGRVSWTKARLGSLLNVKPFLELKDGNVLEFGLSRSRKRGLRRLLNLLHDLGPLEYLTILHTNAKEDAQQLLADYALELPETTLLVNVTTVIGTHVGPNGLGFAAVVK